MSFRKLEQRIAAVSPKDASIRLVTRKTGARPACIVSLRAAFALAVGWKSGTGVAVYLGDDDDAGKLRLMRGATPAITTTRVLKKGGLTFDLGFVPGLNGGRSSDKFAIEAVLLDEDTVELRLPDWDGGGEAAEDDVDASPAAKRPVPPPAPRAPPAAAKKPNGRPAPVAPPVTHGGVHIDFTPDEETVTFGGKSMEVTARQAEMIAMLARGMPNPIARSFLRSKIFGANPPTTADLVLDTMAIDLTKAVDAIGLVFKTVKGLGYALAPKER